MGLKLIGVSCLEVGVLHPSILKTERPPRHLISAGLIPHHEHLLARSALPRERVRSMAQNDRSALILRQVRSVSRRSGGDAYDPSVDGCPTYTPPCSRFMRCAG